MSAADSQPRRRLLDADPTIASRLAAPEREAAREALVVDVVALAEGPWTPSTAEPDPGHLGFLITTGLMTRELRVAGARSIELLNQGDLLRPWDEESASFVQASWFVRTPIEIAVLDRPAAMNVARWPELVSALAERALHRSRSLAVHAAVENMRGLEDRLLTLFWHLAERWGKRAADGVVVPFDLTHQMLSDLVGARRPSVTTALGALRREGLLERSREGWTLRSEPPTPEAPPRHGVATQG